MKSSTKLRNGVFLLLMTTLASLGCGSRERPAEVAPSSEPPPVSLQGFAAEEAADSTAVSGPAETERPEALADKAAEADAARAVADRAAELEDAEAELVERMQELDRQMFELEAREFELARAEAEREAEEARRIRAEEVIPAVEMIPVEEATPAEEVMPVRMQAARGASLDIEFMDALSSELSETGNTVRARVVGGAVPAGTTLWGQVAEARSERKIGASSRLVLAFREMELPTGQLVPIEAELAIEGVNRKKKDAATIGGSAAGGAILGRILSKNRKKGKGTAVGAILGAAVGAAIASEKRREPVVIEPGQSARVELSETVEWTAQPTGPAQLVARGY